MFIALKSLFLIRFAFYMYKVSLYVAIQSRKFVIKGARMPISAISNDYLLNKLRLQMRLNVFTQKGKYNFGFPYQSLDILSIFGERSTEGRYIEYELNRYIKSNDKILDLGCNCGFLLIYSIFKHGCNGYGIDHDLSAIKMAKQVSAFFSLRHKLNFEVKRIQELKTSRKYSKIFSMATYYTDDFGYRVTLQDHFELLHQLLERGGLIFFESHVLTSVTKKELNYFFKQQNSYRVLNTKKVDNDTRLFYVLQKIN